MPFGISVAGDVFQRKLDTIFGNIPQVTCIAYDIMVIGYNKDHSDHDKAFSQLLHTAQLNNIKLNYDKLQYKKTQISSEKRMQLMVINQVLTRCKQFPVCHSQ